MTLYDWPRAAAFGRVIPKNKIYEHAEVNTALKNIFVNKVEQILWSHKLSPETVNLTATKHVSEIQVLQIKSRAAKLNQGVLRAIDRAIPFPLIFELIHGRRICLIVAYKRQSEADGTRWVMSDYFEGEWQLEDAPRVPFPVALNMGALYEQLLSPLVEGQIAQLTSGMDEAQQVVPASNAPGNLVSLRTRVVQAEEVKAKVREIERIESRLTRQKQFNKRVTINTELRTAKQELERLVLENPTS